MTQKWPSATPLIFVFVIGIVKDAKASCVLVRSWEFGKRQNPTKSPVYLSKRRGSDANDTLWKRGAQRIALARALAVEPRVLLLDEPFGALDAKVRKELRRWLRHLHEEIQVTSVFVTHDQEEALEVADRVVVLDKGHIEQTGTPEQVYEQPANAFVHEFIGDSIALPIAIDGGVVHFAGQALEIDHQDNADGDAALLIRPHDVTILDGSHTAALRGTIKRVHGLGAARRVEIAVAEGGNEHLIEVDTPRDQTVAQGQVVTLLPKAYRIFGKALKREPAAAD